MFNVGLANVRAACGRVPWFPLRAVGLHHWREQRPCVTICRPIGVWAMWEGGGGNYFWLDLVDKSKPAKGWAYRGELEVRTRQPVRQRPSN